MAAVSREPLPPGQRFKAAEALAEHRQHHGGSGGTECRTDSHLPATNALQSLRLSAARGAGPDFLDLPRLLVGSEGTLALFTEATLRTIALPGGRSIVLLGFASLEAALRAAQRTLASGPTSCELLDRRLLSLARGNDGTGSPTVVPPAIEAVLLVAYEADTPAEASARPKTGGPTVSQ